MNKTRRRIRVLFERLACPGGRGRSARMWWAGLDPATIARLDQRDRRDRGDRQGEVPCPPDAVVHDWCTPRVCVIRSASTEGPQPTNGPTAESMRRKSVGAGRTFGGGPDRNAPTAPHLPSPRTWGTNVPVGAYLRLIAVRSGTGLSVRCAACHVESSSPTRTRTLARRPASVVAVEAPIRRPRVVLDRTVFYPGGGGQPADRGTLRRAADGTTWVVPVGAQGGRRDRPRARHRGRRDARRAAGRRRRPRRRARLGAPLPAHAHAHGPARPVRRRLARLRRAGHRRQHGARLGSDGLRVRADVAASSSARSRPASTPSWPRRATSGWPSCRATRPSRSPT